MNKIIRLSLGFLLIFNISKIEVSANILNENNQNQTLTDSLGFVGKEIPSEKKTWIDDTTGYEITQWTSISTSHHPYFTVDSFIDDKTAIIFEKSRERATL